MDEIFKFIAIDNPFIKHRFTADPTALIHGDTLYLYTGHDEASVESSTYVMHDWRCFSTRDLVHWQEHPSPLKAVDFLWAKNKAYASDVIEKNGKFYWYVAVDHKTIAGTAIGVAVSDSPTGPYKDESGRAVVTHAMLPATSNAKANLDPSVLIDKDDQAYIFWGNGQCYFAKLAKNMLQLDGPVITLELPGFEEGAHIHYRNGWYYLAYGYTMPEKVAYAMSRNISGPWQFRGIINEVAGNCETNRPSIINYLDKDLFIYHNGALKTGGSHRRAICIDHLYYNDDGSIRPVIMTTRGIWGL